MTTSILKAVSSVTTPEVELAEAKAFMADAIAEVRKVRTSTCPADCAEANEFFEEAEDRLRSACYALNMRYYETYYYEQAFVR